MPIATKVFFHLADFDAECRKSPVSVHRQIFTRLQQYEQTYHTTRPDLKLLQISRFKVSRLGSMIQKGKNRRFRPISQISVDSEMAQSVNTFSELNILGSYDFYHLRHPHVSYEDY
jgi:hypothetical protein